MVGHSAMEVITKRRIATLGPVQLMVCGVPGLPGVAAAEHVDMDMNPESGHVPHHNMEAIIVWESLGRIGPATPRLVLPSSLPKGAYPGTATYLSLLLDVWLIEWAELYLIVLILEIKPCLKKTISHEKMLWFYTFCLSILQLSRFKSNYSHDWLSN